MFEAISLSVPAAHEKALAKNRMHAHTPLCELIVLSRTFQCYQHYTGWAGHLSLRPCQSWGGMMIWRVQLVLHMSSLATSHSAWTGASGLWGLFSHQWFDSAKQSTL